MVTAERWCRALQPSARRLLEAALKEGRKPDPAEIARLAIADMERTITLGNMANPVQVLLTSWLEELAAAQVNRRPGD